MEARNQDRLDRKPPQFVILWHSLPSPPEGSFPPLRSSHFDFMFEDGGHLVTFEVPRMPIPGERLRLIRLGNHRVDYLQLEGKLAPGLQGEDRGYVTRWAAGTFQCLRQSPAKRIIELTSDRFSAQIVLMPKPKIEKLPIDESVIQSSHEPETELILPGSNPLATPLESHETSVKQNSLPHNSLPSRMLPDLRSNDLWPEVEDWDMYVSRWALKEKNV